jgi:hypothetical protein
MPARSDENSEFEKLKKKLSFGHDSRQLGGPPVNPARKQDSSMKTISFKL